MMVLGQAGSRKAQPLARRMGHGIQTSDCQIEHKNALQRPLHLRWQLLNR